MQGRIWLSPTVTSSLYQRESLGKWRNVIVACATSVPMVRSSSKCPYHHPKGLQYCIFH